MPSIRRTDSLRTVAAASLFTALATVSAAVPFTYQGRLTDNGLAPTGVYDIQVRLMTAVSGGTQIGSLVTFNDVSVVGGLFTVNPDFGSSVNLGVQGQALEIRVRPGASTGAYTILAPRRALRPSPSANTVYNRTVIVRPVGTDLENGTALLGALASLSDTNSTNRSLIWIEPGTYDVGNSPVILLQGMSLRGSGSNSSFIDGTAGNSSATLGLVRCTGFNQIEGVQVRSFSSGGNHATGISRGTSGEVLMRDVSVYVSGAITASTGFVDNAGGILRWEGGDIVGEDIPQGTAINFVTGTADAVLRDLDMRMNLDSPGPTSLIAVRTKANTDLDWSGGEIDFQGGLADDTTLSVIGAAAGGAARVNDIRGFLGNSESIVPFEAAHSAALEVSDCNIRTHAEGGANATTTIFSLTGGSSAQANGCHFSEDGPSVEFFTGINLVSATANVADSTFTSSQAFGSPAFTEGTLAKGDDSNLSLSDVEYVSTGYDGAALVYVDLGLQTRLSGVRGSFECLSGIGIDIFGGDAIVEGVSISADSMGGYTGVRCNLADSAFFRDVDVLVTETPDSGNFRAEGLIHNSDHCAVDGFSFTLRREDSSVARTFDITGINVGPNLLARNVIIDAIPVNSSTFSSARGVSMDSNTKALISDSVLRVGSEGIFNMGLNVEGGTLRANNVRIYMTGGAASWGRAIYSPIGSYPATIYCTNCFVEFEGALKGIGLWVLFDTPNKAYFDGGELKRANSGKAVDGWSSAATPNIFLSNARINNFVPGAFEKHTACIDQNYNPIP